MTSRRAVPGSHRAHGRVRLRANLPRPWELIAHFLAVYPPGEDQPLDDKAHADVTSLATKLAEGPSEAWDGTWARDPRKYRRVAASIAMRIATGELKPWASLSHQQVRDTYGVSAHAVSYAVGESQDRGILGNFGGRLNAVPREWIRVPSARERQARILDLIAAHVISLEAELSTLKADTAQ